MLPVLVGLGLGLAPLARADPARSGAEAGGEVRTTARVGLIGCGEVPVLDCPLLDFHDAAVFTPWVRAAPAPEVVARAEVELRLHGGTALPEEDGVDQSGDPQKVAPVSVRFIDAWVARRGERLDLSVGAQRVAWGVSPGFSVVDEVNPWDLEDPTRFDQRLSTASAVVTLHRKGMALQGVWAPWFLPAALPTGSVDLMAGGEDLFDEDLGANTDTEIGEVSTRVTVPEATLGNGTLAGRLRWTGGPMDVALSWIHGRDSLPQVDGEVILTGFQTARDRVDIGIPVVYPRREMAGLAIRGRLPWDLTAAGEVALVLPAETSAAPSQAQLEALERLGTIDEVPDPIPDTVTQDGQPYSRSVLGVERELGSVYASAQWLRGFPTERRRAELRNYALLGARWNPVASARVEGHLASDAPEVLAGRRPGWLVDVELGWLMADALELEVGATWIDGDGESALAGFSAVSHVRMGGRLVF